MGRARPNEATIVEHIVGFGKYPKSILEPVHEQLEGQDLNVHFAFYRIILGLELVAQWDDYISGKFPNNPPDPNATLRGGASSAQNLREGNNPPGTQQGHYVQAAVDNVEFSTLPPELKRLFGHTMYVPTVHNQGIHRSIDNAQQFLIAQYNTDVVQNKKLFEDWFNADLALAYCDKVLELIEKDAKAENYQYSKTDTQDFQDYYFTVQSMRNTFEEKMQHAQANGLGTGRDFVSDQESFKP